MATQQTLPRGSSSYMRDSLRPDQLIQQNDPLLDYIPHLKDLTCNQILPSFSKVSLRFFAQIHGVGNATNDLKDLSRNKVLKYLTIKPVCDFLENESLDNQQILKQDLIKVVMALTALFDAHHYHYRKHRGSETPIDQCLEPINIFEDVLCRSYLSIAKLMLNVLPLQEEKESINDVAYKLFTCVKQYRPVTAISESPDRSFLNNRLQTKCQTHRALREAESLYNRSESFQAFMELLNVPESISRLAEFLFDPEPDGRNFSQFTENLVQEHRRKKADAIADSLLKQVEEETKKTNHNKQQPPKKLTKSLKKASVSPHAQPSNVEEKEQPSLKQAARPKEKVIPPEISLFKQLNQIVRPDLSLHSRITRWATVTPETIKNIKDWDEKTKQWIYPYTMDPDPEYTIASHNLAPIKRILRSTLAPFYAREYSFVDINKIQRKGWALIATMHSQGKEELGTVFTGVGDDNVLYHAHFKPFDPSTPNGAANLLFELHELVCINKVSPEKTIYEDWKLSKTFSMMPAPEDGKVLLIMENRKKSVKFVFHPLSTEA